MAVTVVDTGVLIGMADADDEHHGGATEIVRGMDHGDLPPGRVTNYVALETLNWIHDRKRHEKAVETYERLNQSAGFEVLNAPQKDFPTAVELFETHEGLSFGDATIQRSV
jgi:predicted nucleic acid-binding protein